MQHAVSKQIEEFIRRRMTRGVGLMQHCRPGDHDIAQIGDHSRRSNKCGSVLLDGLLFFSLAFIVLRP